MRISDAFEAFVEHGRHLRGFSEQTIAAYRSDARALFRFMQARGLSPDLGEITPALIGDLLLEMKRSQLSITTIHRRRNAYSSFLQFSVNQGWMQSNPATRVELAPKPRVVRSHYLTSEDMHRFVATRAAIRGAPPAMMEALRWMMAATGCRRQEVLHLQWEHIDLAAGVLTVYNSKNTARKGNADGKDRDVPLCMPLAESLTNWRSEGSGTGPVFATKPGRPIGKDALASWVEAACKEAGLDQVTPHVFRHSLATGLAQLGYTEADVSLLLGHSPRTTTQGYIHSSLDRLRKAVGDWANAVQGVTDGTATAGRAPEPQKEPAHQNVNPAGATALATLADPTVLARARSTWTEIASLVPDLGGREMPLDFTLGFAAGLRARGA